MKYRTDDTGKKRRIMSNESVSSVLFCIPKYARKIASGKFRRLDNSIILNVYTNGTNVCEMNGKNCEKCLCSSWVHGII